MALAYDPLTGQVVEGVQQAPSSGVPESVLKSGKVPMLDNVGNPVFVDSKDVDSAISQGFQYESPEQEVERKKEEKYGNSPFLAGTLGFARSLSFGGTDVAGRALGFADAIREIRERNQASSVSGEVAGAVAPLIATLGAAAPATAASTAATAARFGTAGKGLLTLGRVAEATAPALITKGAENVAKKLVAEGWKRVAVQGALEGAGFGAGQAVTDIALTEGDITPDRVAESLISNVGMGAFMGGALSLGAYGAGKGLGKITDPIKKKLLGTLGQSENAIAPGSIVPDTDYGILEQTIRKSNADDLIRIAKEAGIENVDDIPAEILLKSQKAQGQAVELGKRDTLFGWEQARKQANFKEKVSEYGQKVFDDVAPITDFEAGESLKSSFKKKIESFVESAGKRFEKARESTKFIPLSDKAKTQIVANIQRIPEYRLDSTIKGQLDSVIDSIVKAQNADELKTIATLINKNMISPASRSGQYESARVLRDALGKVRNFEESSILRASIEQAPTKAEGAKIAKQLTDDLRTSRKQWAELHSTLEEVFGEGAAKLARGKIDPYKILDRLETMSGEEVLKKFSTTKNFRALKKLQKDFPEEFAVIRQNFLFKVKEKATEEGVLNVPKMVRQMTDDKVSPEALKIILGSEYGKIQNLRKIVEANPKAFVNWSNTASTAFNDSVAMGLVFNTFANIKDAVLYGKLYKLPAMVQAVNKTEAKLNTRITQFVNNATKQVSSSVRGGAVVIANNMKEKNYQGRLDKLEELAANPDKILDHVVDSTTGVSDDPALQSALQTKGMQAANFLIEKMPKRPEMNNVFGASPKYKPSDQELSKWNRYVRAVDNPMTVLDDLNAGILTPESVEAVRTIYPEIYAQMSQKMIDKMATVKKPISYQAKLQISTLLGVPISSALGPQFIQSMQGNIQPEQEEQKPQKINAGQVSKSKFSERAQSSTNRLLSR